ncbi:hypothetical protein TR51_01800 [Kitasatospora griseola]|uniref:Uncharacterized protein n=1 Tax=Kitasatospora griseola TaxID=2064 RepID=A0A0D0Q1G8_KITGR|nr:hypothetical protein [Kitasatospora griseola]KIQ66387.1 hypothetical protein TR51_01800 [Kitasatospora griseola]
MTSNADMINFVLNWIHKHPTGGQEANWTVAITGAPAMIISKADGATSGLAGMRDLSLAIKEQGWYHTLKGAYLAQTFTRDGNNTHAEMCILAGAKSLNQSVVDMKCASPNCQACADTLACAKVNNQSSCSTTPQSGWVHPFWPMALGTQLTASWENQIKELKAFNKLSDEAKKNFKNKYTMRLTSPPAGGCVEIP